jgi:thiol-disulfide isomerase/thioredoxin
MIKITLSFWVIMFFSTIVHAQDLPNKEVEQSLKGDWFSSDGSPEWRISFTDSILIYNGQVWKYKINRGTKSERLAISMHQDNTQKTIYAIREGDGYRFGEELKSMLRHSRTPLKKYTSATKNDRPYKLPILKPDSVTYCGYFRGYDTDSDFKTGRIVVTDVTTGNKQTYLIEVRRDGSFSVKFAMNYPHALFVDFPGYRNMVFFEPGATLFQLIDLKGPKKANLFMGSTARLNMELQEMSDFTSIDYAQLDKDVAGFSPSKYKGHLSKIETSILNKIEVYKKDNPISKKTEQVILFQVKYHIADLKLSYRQKVSGAIAQVLDSSYFDYIADLPVENKLSLISERYESFLIGLRSSASIYVENFIPTIVPQERLFEQLLVQERLPHSEAGLLRAFIAMKAQGEELDRTTRAFHLNYTDQSIIDILRLYEKKFSGIAYEIGERMRIKKMKTFFNLKTSFITDLLLSREEYEIINLADKPFTEAYFQQLKYQITDNALIATLRVMNNRKPEINNKNSVAAKLTLTAERLTGTGTGQLKTIEKSVESDLFHRITNQFKGKVIVVDFWATWCSPCLAGINYIKTLKDELAKEDIVFVYITDQTSPTDTYNKMAVEISGQHFRLSSDEWNILSKQFNIIGIPHQVLIDKMGNVIDPSFRPSDNNMLKAVLMEQVMKQ